MNGGHKIAACVLSASMLLSMATTAMATTQVVIPMASPEEEKQQEVELVQKQGDGYTSIVITDGSEEIEKPHYTGEKVDNTVKIEEPKGPKLYPFEITNVDEDGDMLVVKSYRVDHEIDPQDLVETKIHRKDHPYKMRDILAKQLPGKFDEITANKTVTITTDTKDQSAVLKQFSTSVTYNENGYTGSLSLKPETLNIEAGDKSSYSYGITDTREYPGLQTMDTASVAKTVKKNGATLQLAGVDWQPMGSTVDESGNILTNYKAVAHYKGTGYGSKTTSYIATAQYEGTAKKETEGDYIYTIVYAPMTPKELEEYGIQLRLEEEKNNPPETISDETKFFTIIFLLASIGMIYFLWQKKKWEKEQAEKKAAEEAEKYEDDIEYTEDVIVPDDAQVEAAVIAEDEKNRKDKETIKL